MGAKAKDHFENETAFMAMLEEAEEKAVGDWETKFVDDMSTNAGRYGMDTFMSDSQYDQLKRIADK